MSFCSEWHNKSTVITVTSDGITVLVHFYSTRSHSAANALDPQTRIAISNFVMHMGTIYAATTDRVGQ